MELMFFWIAALVVIVIDFMARTMTSKIFVVVVAILAMIIDINLGKGVLAALWGVVAALNLIAIGRMLP